MNPFKSLDDLILRGHQKVADKAFDKLGWSKWDLVNYANMASFIGWEGIYTYDFIGNTLRGHGSGIATDLAALAMGYGLYRVFKWINKGMESKEGASLQKDSVVVKHGNIFERYFRPVLPFIVVLGVGQTIRSFAYPESTIIPEVLPPSNPDGYVSAQQLVHLTSTLYSAGFMSMLYFRDCLPRPGAKDKQPLWKRALNYLKSKVTPAPELQPQEISNGQYQSLENRI